MKKRDENSKNGEIFDFPVKIFLAAASLILLWHCLENISSIFELCTKIGSVLSPVAYGFAAAFVINLFMRPAENLFDKVFKKRKVSFSVKRAVCLTISLAVCAGIILFVIFMIVPEIVRTATSFFGELPDRLNIIEKSINEFCKGIGISGLELPIPSAEKIGEMTKKIFPHIGFGVVNKTVDFTANLVSFAANCVLSFFFAVYMLAEKEKLCLVAKKLLFAVCDISAAKNILRWSDLVNTTFTKFAAGQLTEAVILGTLCFIGMIILRIPYSVAISVLVGFTALIPVFGAFMGAAVGFFLIATVNFEKAVVFLLFLIILQQAEGNVIYPRVVGKSVGLPGILVLTAVTVGAKLFNMAGLILSVPVCSVIYIAVKIFVNERSEKRV